MTIRKTPTTSAYVQELLERRSDVELTFARHRRTSTVHILIPVDPDVPPTSEPILTDADFNVLDWVVGKRRALCGWVARIHLGGFEGGDEVIDAFADSALCARCHAALGAHAPRAFEHPTSDAVDDGADSTTSRRSSI